jgi:hypothetical protein
MSELELNPLTQQIHAIVSRYSRLSDSIIRAQCKGIGKEPKDITLEDVPELAKRIATAVGMFTNPEKATAVERAIRKLSGG